MIDLENWSIGKTANGHFFLRGVCTNHPNFPDGSWIGQTSNIVSMNKENQTALTRSGNEYKLVKENSFINKMLMEISGQGFDFWNYDFGYDGKLHEVFHS